MARDIFGNKKITKEDKYTGKSKFTNADIRWEQFKIVLLILITYIWFHFIIMGWTL
jgi:hypothetical protein